MSTRCRLTRCWMMLCCLAAAATALAEVPIVVPLQYEQDPKRDPSRALGFMPYGMSGTEQFSATAPEGVKLPKLVSQTPAFGIIEVAGRKFHAALDCVAAEGKFYDRLYFDRNGNKDLTDDRMLNSVGGSERSADFGRIEIGIGEGSRRRPYSFTVEARNFTFSDDKNYLKPDQVSCWLHSNAVFAGRFSHGDKQYRVVISDQNCNGTFTDCHSAVEPGKITATSGGKQVLFSEGDAFLMTDGATLDANDLLVLGTHLVLGEATYRVEIDAPGRKMSLTPVAGENLVTLSVPQGTKRLELVAQDKKSSIMLIDPAATVRIPAGKYTMFKYVLHKKDARGATWCAVAQVAGRDEPGPAVTVDGKAPLRYGEPFTIEADAPYNRPGDAEVMLALNIRDRAGMDVRGVFHVAGDKTAIPLSQDKAHPAEPSYTIKGPDGAQAASGAFEYG